MRNIPSVDKKISRWNYSILRITIMCNFSRDRRVVVGQRRIVTNSIAPLVLMEFSLSDKGDEPLIMHFEREWSCVSFRPDMLVS